jgi:hypothetical protein
MAIKRTFVYFAFMILLFTSVSFSEIIELKDSRIIRGRVIDKTPTKYIIEVNDSASGNNEVFEIEISEVLSIKEEPAPVVGDTVPPLVEQQDQEGSPESESIENKPNDFLSRTGLYRLRSAVDKARTKANDFLSPYMLNILGARKDRISIVLLSQPGDVVIGLFFFIMLIMFGPFLFRNGDEKNKITTNVDKTEALDYQPLKSKKLFKGIPIPNVSVFIKTGTDDSLFLECLLKQIDYDSVTLITNVKIPDKTTVKLVLIREKKIGRTVIKEDLDTGADVKESKDSPVKGHYEINIAFHHLFLSQRAFINKIILKE